MARVVVFALFVIVTLASAAPQPAMAQLSIPAASPAGNFIRLAINEIQLGNWSDAQLLLEKALELDPASNLAAGLLGLVQENQREYAAAVANLERAIADKAVMGNEWAPAMVLALKRAQNAREQAARDVAKDREVAQAKREEAAREGAFKANANYRRDKYGFDEKSWGPELRNFVDRLLRATGGKDHCFKKNGEVVYLFFGKDELGGYMLTTMGRGTPWVNASVAAVSPDARDGETTASVKGRLNIGSILLFSGNVTVPSGGRGWFRVVTTIPSNVDDRSMSWSIVVQSGGAKFFDPLYEILDLREPTKCPPSIR